MKYLFPREIRLVTTAQFKKVLSKSKEQKKISSELFTIYFCCTNLESPRLGVIVPKKNVNKSSRRNYFKRIIREQFRLNQYKFKKLDMVVFVNNSGKTLSKKELNSKLEKQFNKLLV